MVLNRRDFNHSVRDAFGVTCLRMMLNRRPLNLLQEILTVSMCLRMMLNRRPLNQIESVYERVYGKRESKFFGNRITKYLRLQEYCYAKVRSSAFSLRFFL